MKTITQWRIVSVFDIPQVTSVVKMKIIPVKTVPVE